MNQIIFDPFSSKKFLEITTKIGCKNNCLYCPQDLFVKSYLKRSDELEMKLETFELCLRKLPLEVNIIFSGMCEPWLNKNCTKMLKMALDKGHQVFVFTTLVGMSIDKDLVQLKKIKFPKDFGFIVHLPSVDKIESINVSQEYLDNVSYVVKNNLASRFHYYGQDIDNRIKKIVPNDKLFKMDLNDRSGNLKCHDLVEKINKSGQLKCSRNLHNNVLLPNGEVILCCQDYALKHILGNLKTENYQTLFKGKEFLKVKNGLINKNSNILCRHCYFACELNRNNEK